MNDSVVDASGTVTDATHQPNPNEVQQGTPTPEATPSDDRPDWLPEKFQSPEDLAKSYTELEAKMSGKTEDIKQSLLEEIQSASKEGVPDEPDGYEIPEGYTVNEEEKGDLWKKFTEWSHERNLSQDDFNELVTFYAETASFNPEREREKLGNNAQERLDTLSRWIGANVPETERQMIIDMAQSAEFVQVMETMMKLTVPQKMPGQTDAPVIQEEMTDDSIRQLMASPAYLDPAQRDPEVVKKVDEYYRNKYSDAG